MQFLSMRQGEVTFVANRISGFFKRCFPVSAGDCLKTLFGLFLATASCIILRELNPGDDYMAAVQVIYVLAAFMIARFSQGFLYGTFAAVAGVLLTNFIFTYPYWAFNFTLPGYPVTILCALIVSVTTSTMTARIKEQGQLQLEAEREKMRSNLLRAVSHDLRTPLTSILGASSAILENDSVLTAKERLTLLGEIHEDAEWLVGMVENLLTVTRVDGAVGANLNKVPEAAEEVVAEAVSKFRKRFPERVISASVPDDLLMVPMDAMLIKQVIINLLENVAFHTPPDTRARLTVSRQGKNAQFCVSDNGAGISPERLAHIFDGMFQRDREDHADAHHSMGIGLSVCNSIVKAHGGTMEARNVPGGGAEFTFRLPLEEE